MLKMSYVQTMTKQPNRQNPVVFSREKWEVSRA